jgi:hypothetical protein
MLYHSSILADLEPGLFEGKNTGIQLADDLFVCGERPDWGTFSIVVPKGFITNGASIPSFGKWYVGGSIDGLYLLPAIVHDALYEMQMDKARSDLTFYRAMLDTGVDEKKAWIMWKSVSWFGKGAWKSPSPLNTHLINKIIPKWNDEKHFARVKRQIALKATKGQNGTKVMSL